MNLTDQPAGLVLRCLDNEHERVFIVLVSCKTRLAWSEFDSRPRPDNRHRIEFILSAITDARFELIDDRGCIWRTPPGAALDDGGASEFAGAERVSIGCPACGIEDVDY